MAVGISSGAFLRCPALSGRRYNTTVATPTRPLASPGGFKGVHSAATRSGGQRCRGPVVGEGMNRCCGAQPALADEVASTSGAAPPPLADLYPEDMFDATGKLMLKNLTLEGLTEWCLAVGEDEKRAMHMWRWMYYDKNWIRALDDTEGRQNGFAKAFRDMARDIATLDGGLELKTVQRAEDGTRKMVFKLTEGPAAGGTIETVLIPVVRENGRKPRITICVSSQVGCAMNCQFCYTGRMGLMGNLTSAQIVEQVVEARRFMAEEGDPVPITNIVFMGMGEPFDNLDAVLRATEVLCQPMGMHFSQNKVTVSTVGLVPQIREFVERSPAQLALSLHATTDEVRDWIAPVNRRYPLDELMGTLEELFPRGRTPGAHGRHVLFEYVMLRDVNDTEGDARRLLELTENIECKVNLIVFNPHKGTFFLPSHMEAVLAFRSILIQGGRVCTIRDSRGDDEMAACGQLGDPSRSHKKGVILEPPPSLQHVIERVAQASSTSA